MKPVHAVLDSDKMKAVTAPREGLVRERAVAVENRPLTGPAEYRFCQEKGPLAAYERRVVVARAGPDAYYVEQAVHLRVGLPWWSWLLTLPVQAHLNPLRPSLSSGAAQSVPWWAPPALLDRRSAGIVATLAALSTVQGFVSGLLPVTLTFAASQFHKSTFDQGLVFALVQMSALPALAALVLADKRGRRRVVLWACAGAVAASEVGGLAPSISFLAGAQVCAGALLGAATIATVVVAVEEVPAGARAWSVGVLTLALGLGAGVPLAMLPLAGLGTGSWRLLYLASAACMPVVLGSARHLPESRRWAAGRGMPASPGTSLGTGASLHDRRPPGAVRPYFWLSSRSRPRLMASSRGTGRLVMVCTGVFLFAVFSAPSAVFQTQFLVDSRHYSAGAVSLLEQLAGTLGGVGTLASGRLADTRGRRPVGMVCVAGAAVFMLGAYSVAGWPMWLLDIGAQVFFYAVTPVLAVYGAELFATSSRAAKAGMVSASSALGATAGLVLLPALSDGPPGFASGLALLAVGPAILVLLIATRFPESAGTELEAL